nr:unnamed protein product [Haemonchus contortus]
MDDFNAYRAMCANRLRRLERYRKARSFCNIDDENPSSASEIPISAPPYCAEDAPSSEHFFTGTSRGSGSAAFEVIREKMVLGVAVQVCIKQNPWGHAEWLWEVWDPTGAIKSLHHHGPRAYINRSLFYDGR